MVGARPDPELARRKYRAEAEGYDRRTRLLDRYRGQAIARLALRRGATVVDVACGTGANFQKLHDRVGDQGRIIGIDLSREMLAIARTRVDRAGWQNVTLIEAPVEDASLELRADAGLFSFTHDVLQSPVAIANMLRQLRPGASVVSVGGKSPSRWLLPLHLAARSLGARYVTTLVGYNRPWESLASGLHHLLVEQRALGAVYIARGHTPP